LAAGALGLVNQSSTRAIHAVYPTPEHQTAAETIVEFWTTRYNLDAVLLVNSCARGQATRDSCLDLVALARPEWLRSQLSTLEADWARFFDRLYNAYREFLQALFIARRTYPIAYNKWTREQVEEILGLPELYTQLTRLFEIKQFESSEIADKAKEVEQLLEKYAPAPGTS
jgi:hypothetical protein